MYGNENQGESFETKEDNHSTKENDLIELIIKAQKQEVNCLDLSKRNIKDFPDQLLELTSLQVIDFHNYLYFFLLFVVSIYISKGIN
jgi:hypothetical protein